MNSTDLYARYRADVVDQAEPYLWSDDEVFGYMDTAYKSLVRAVGGISDALTPDVVQVPITSGQPYSPLHSSILNIRTARLSSTGATIKIVNSQDIKEAWAIDYGPGYDYGATWTTKQEWLPGPVHFMVLGEADDQCRWVQVPQADDTALLLVYRLPLEDITDFGQDFELRSEHHIHLLKGMKAQAYMKQDAETFDRAKARENQDAFDAYCAQARDEWERRMRKPYRAVVYGGI